MGDASTDSRAAPTTIPLRGWGGGSAFYRPPPSHLLHISEIILNFVWHKQDDIALSITITITKDIHHKVGRYSFSGHESFHCKSLWLKKGYDFLVVGGSFTDADSVVKLGVGKNMVASIRFWLRAFGLTKMDEVQPEAEYIFDAEKGKDPFAEDANTLWILHFLLIFTDVSSIYRLLFVDFQREKREFSKSEFQAFIKRKCMVPEQKNAYNENTVKKDIGVLLKNYVAPVDLKSLDDFSALLISLGIIVRKGDDTFIFAQIQEDAISPIVLLYALLKIKGEDRTISFDKLQEISLIFGLGMVQLIEKVRELENKYPDMLAYTDNSGVKNVQFLKEINCLEALDLYYDTI